MFKHFWRKKHIKASQKVEQSHVLGKYASANSDKLQAISGHWDLSFIEKRFSNILNDCDTFFISLQL